MKGGSHLVDTKPINNLIDKDIILKYLDKELENMSNPKKEKSIPYETRVGSILTIKTIKQFIINSHWI